MIENLSQKELELINFKSAFYTLVEMDEELKAELWNKVLDLIYKEKRKSNFTLINGKDK